MNIINNKPSMIVENLDDKSNRLFESYKKSTNQRQFLNENGDTDENKIIFNFLGLNESVNDASARFTFSNGMYIPGLGTKVSGRLSLNNIFESTTNEDEYIECVKNTICEGKLMFNATIDDIIALRESYKEYSKTSLNS